MTSVLKSLGADPHGERVDRDAGVGHRDADVVLGRLALARGVRRVDRDAGPRGRLRPLELEVLGRRDDGDPVDDAAAEQLGGDASARRSSCRRRASRRRGSRGVSGRSSPSIGRRLPGAQGRRRPPRCSLGPRRSERGHSSVSPCRCRRLERLPDLLALGADRELLRRPAGDPDLAAQGHHGGAHHHRLGELVLLDVVGETLVIALVGRDGAAVLLGTSWRSRSRSWSPARVYVPALDRLPRRRARVDDHAHLFSATAAAVVLDPVHRPAAASSVGADPDDRRPA